MYKVFLVEDEVVIRSGIKRSIAWEQEGYEFVGEASDGELAYPLIKKERPDILITDIRMPFMDGLELSRLVKKDLPQIKIVILSGFNEFEYAKTAINLGVTEYLLKPINAKGLLDALRKVTEQIDEDRRLEGMMERYRQELEGARSSAPLEDPIEFSKVDPKQMDWAKVRNFLRTGSAGDIDAFVDEFFRDIIGKAMKSGMFRQYIAMDMYFCAADFLEEMEVDRELLETPDPQAGIFQSEEAALSYMKRVLLTAMQQRDRKAQSRYHEVVEEAVRYIHEHYADEDLSLNTLASYVNFSPNHLSMVFAQETGVTFIRYLTDFRMNKAKELLRCTGKKSSEIALDVGYQDPHYFSSLFKKTQGMTPTQYRFGTEEQ